MGRDNKPYIKPYTLALILSATFAVILRPLGDVLRQAALRDQPQVCLAQPLQVPWDTVHRGTEATGEGMGTE